MGALQPHMKCQERLKGGALGEARAQLSSKDELVIARQGIGRAGNLSGRGGAISKENQAAEQRI